MIKYIKFQNQTQNSQSLFSYHLKNAYYDQFSVNESPVDKLIIEYQNNIELKTIDFLPTLPFKSKKIVQDFVPFYFANLIWYRGFSLCKNIETNSKYYSNYLL